MTTIGMPVKEGGTHQKRQDVWKEGNSMKNIDVLSSLAFPVNDPLPKSQGDQYTRKGKGKKWGNIQLLIFKIGFFLKAVGLRAGSVKKKGAYSIIL